jgi:hypothetical protein
MKTPRVKDFDPNADIPALKSPLDGMPTIGRPPRPNPQRSPAPETEKAVTNSPTQPIPDRATARPSDEPTNRPPDREHRKRILVRRGFEWYEDQLVALKRLSLQEQMEGRPGSMSEMVREALDDYLNKRSADK